MILQRHRQLGRVRFVVRRLVVRRDAHHLDVILREHAVVEDGEIRALEQLAVAVEHRGVEHDVVGLPLARLAARVHERRVLLVDRRRLAVEVGLVLGTSRAPALRTCS